MRRLILVVFGAVVGIAFAMLVANAYARAVPHLDADMGFDGEPTPVFFDRADRATGERFVPTTDGAVWSIGQGKLALLIDDFHRGFSIDLVAAGAGDPTLLAVDPYDGSAWVVTSRGMLAKFDSDGRVERMAHAPGASSAATVALDQTLWIAADGALLQFDREGVMMVERPLGKAGIDGIAVDSLRDRALVFAGGHVRTLDIRESSLDLVSEFDLGPATQAAALDPITGDVWSLGLDRLTVHSASGAISRIALDGYGTGFDALAFDARRDVFVVASPDGAIRFDRQSHQPAGLDTLDAHEEAVPSPLKLMPSIEVADSSDFGIRGIVLVLGASCNDRPCDVGSDYLSSFTLFASVDEVPFPVSFSFDPLTRETILHLDGFDPFESARVRVHARDRFGHVSEPVEMNLSSPRSTIGLKANQAPAVSITAPINNATFVPGSNITLTATASDSDGTVGKVEFFRSGTLIGTATSSPYLVFWSNVPAGSYGLTAKATDDKGATKTSTAVNIVVKAPPNVPPSIAIISPTNDSTVNGPSVVIAFTAADSDGTIAKVDFFEDAKLLGTATGGSASVISTWTYANATAGSHAIKATATDNAGATTSATVTFTVNAAPWAVLTAPAPCSEVISPADVTLTADAYDADGSVARVEFYQGSTLIGTSSTAPYRHVWTGAPIGKYVLTAVAVDNLGAVRSSNPVSFSVQTPDAPPTVSITAPANNSRLGVGSDVTIFASAADSDGTIKRVELYVGGILSGTATAPPYSAKWVPKMAGLYSLTAKAVDDRGVSSTSAAVTVNVVANAPPTVTLLMPVGGPTFVAPATVTLVAQASDPDGVIRKVQFFYGAEYGTPSILIGEVSSPPYSVAFSITKAGEIRQVMARATDDLGGATNSNVLKIYGNTPPTISMVSPANNSTVLPGASVSIIAQAGDADARPRSVIATAYVNGKTFWNDSYYLYNSWNDNYSFRPVAFPPGSDVTIFAQVTDSNQVSTYSAPVYIKTVPAPSVRLLTPACGDTFVWPANIGFTASASQPLGKITKVNYYVDEQLVGSATTPPYSFTWTNPAVSLSLPYRSVRAEAIDNLGNGGVGNSITCNIAIDYVRLTIDSPISDTTFYRSPIEVRGTYSGATPSRITVNDVSATFGGGLYRATVPLNGGTNVLTAAATSTRGITKKDMQTTFIPPWVFLRTIFPGQVLEALDWTDLGADVEGFANGPKRVDFYRDQTKVGSVSSAPYVVRWQPETGGAFRMSAVAVGFDDSITRSNLVPVSVNPPPGVVIDSPADNSVFSDAQGFLISAIATTIGETFVSLEVWLDGVLVGAAPASPGFSAIGIHSNSPPLTVGNHVFVMRATESGGRILSSAPLHVQVVAGASVRIVEPKDDLRVKSPGPIVLAAKVDTRLATIIKVEFLANDALVATVLEEPFIATWSNVANGTYELRARVTDSSGATADSIAVSVIVADVALNIETPDNGQSVYDSTVTVGGTMSGIPSSASVLVNGVQARIGNGIFAATVPVAGGRNGIVVTATLNGAATTRVISIWRKEPVVTFANVQSGTIAHDDTFLVRGTVSAPANSALVFADKVADIDSEGNFFAEVNLAEGTNFLTAKLIRQDESVTNWPLPPIQRNGLKPFTVTLRPAVGLGVPFTSTLTLERRANVNYDRFQIVKDSRVIFDETVVGEKDRRTFSARIDDAATSTFSVRLVDATGQPVYEKELMLRAVRPEEIDSHIRRAYSDATYKLLAGDIGGAVTAFNPQFQDFYRSVFTDLGTSLPQLVDKFRTVAAVSYGHSHGELTITRTSAAGVQGFQVSAARDYRGIWRFSGL